MILTFSLRFRIARVFHVTKIEKKQIAPRKLRFLLSREENSLNVYITEHNLIKWLQISS